MTNKQIANSFNLLGKLMELHGENQFKVRSYYSAYQALRKLDTPLADTDAADRAKIKGVGKAIHGKIGELIEGGEMDTLNRYIEKTPPGVIEMLSIKGLGPKKVQTIWREMNVESPGELLYACHENRLMEMKGFGAKTQADVIKKLNFYLSSQGQILYPTAETLISEITERINDAYPNAMVSAVGEYAMKLPIITSLEVLVSEEIDAMGVLGDAYVMEAEGATYHGVQLDMDVVDKASFLIESILRSSGRDIQDELEQRLVVHEGLEDEEEVFEANGLSYMPPEIRDYPNISFSIMADIAAELVEEQDIKGVVHSHTLYSDGMYSVQDMAEYSKALGYEYLVITDHSKSAFYANGLSVERIGMQQCEIDQVNASIANFRVLKGIECDILYDGSMDYEDDVLKTFDLVIASIHSQLKMDEAKANERLIRAIEHPQVKMLGHMTGRLLLSREGYPVDHTKIIDACAANRVCIELNANPHRLDIDYRWIKQAMDKDVMISINPDAHNKEGIKDIKFGVAAARKGGLSKEKCLNTLGCEAFTGWLSQ